MSGTREWSKPELVVLGRGLPEENVLCKCKSKEGTCGVGGWAVGGTAEGCGYKPPKPPKQPPKYCKPS
jgi:hypothetical protein